MDQEKKKKYSHYKHPRSSREQQGLERIKREILQEIGVRKNKKQLSWSGSIVTGVLIILTIISVGQTFQSFNILGEIENGAIKSVSAATTTPPASNLKNLPDMVGGC